ncbi:MAG: hypothetical protein AB9903_23450 [Vulcanimicrobiota bacterium]
METRESYKPIFLAESGKMGDLLITYGADVNARMVNNVTPLHFKFANDARRKDIADILRKHGGNE